MTDNSNWRDRLRAAYKRSGRSKYAISLDAGLGPNYLGQVLAGKSAKLEPMIALCSALGISLSELVDEPRKRSAK